MTDTLLDLAPDELRQMNEREAELLAGACLMPDEPVAPGAIHTALGSEFDELPFAMQIIIGRLQVTKRMYSPAVVFWAAGLCTTPGESVMWAHALFELSLSGPVTLSYVCYGPFAEGVPTEEGLARIWDGQKIGGSNYLDTMEAWTET